MPRRPTLLLAGDSTAAQKDMSAAPETGWGMALPFFLAEEVVVDNHAMNGRSSRSFIEEGRLDVVLGALRPGDRLLVQYGHNDQSDRPERHTEPWAGYQECLLRHVKGARDRGAHPVLLTPVERRAFDAGGRAVSTHGAYPDAMRAVAAQENVPLVDVSALSLTRWEQLGPEATKECFLWVGETRDNTHFRPRGAIEVARLVARGLADVGAVPRSWLGDLEAAVPDDLVVWPRAAPDPLGSAAR
ncbi:rhamnogalacturonan acetylesterase [Streptomyces candidus]|uniref:Lysophospholipase L1-like esterase n=1 Tax=Streptomyces candidus TaxID=67283 RepID=A0A7X0LS77_9ACTN|nr:lysophospholipase L1-like esterase [Streptomyces candidus]